MKTTGTPNDSLFGSTTFPILILMGWMALLMSSCTEKDIVYAGEPVKAMVEFDWTDAPQANPEGMTLLLFPADGCSQLWRFDIKGRKGGEIELLSGVYNVIAFNNDLPGVEFTNTGNFDLFSASARNSGNLSTSPTGMLYSATITGQGLFPDVNHTLTIKMKPEALSTVYHISLDSVSGTQRIKTAIAIVRGLARSVCLSRQCNSTDTCCMSAPLLIATDCPGRLETITTGFGNPDTPDPQIYLNVVVTTSHGKYSKTFDVTDRVMNSQHPKDVYINIKGLDIPEADTPTNPDDKDDVGISVGVDGWQLIEIIYS